MTLHRGLIFLAVLALAAPGPAIAQNAAQQPAQTKPLGECLIANSTAEHERQMKTVLIDALKDDTESLNKSVLAMSMGVILLAQQSCSLKMTDLETPEFSNAMQAYGEFMGEKIFSAALAKLDK